MKNRRVKLQKKNSKTEDLIHVELDTRCSCSSTKADEHASIQFARRYLECQGSMPIRIIRLYIEKVLPHSPTVEVVIYDSTDRQLNDSDRLRDISSSPSISLRFSMMNTITSLGHCMCTSPLLSIEKDCSSSSPTVIRRETINRTLSTCPLVPTPPHSPSSSPSPIPKESSTPIVNLLTPPSPTSTATTAATTKLATQHYSSFLIDNIVETDATDPSLIDKITSEFGEICSSYPTAKPKRSRTSKKSIPKSTSSFDVPLDLTLKKRPSSFDLFSTQSKWLKMI